MQQIRPQIEPATQQAEPLRDVARLRRLDIRIAAGAMLLNAAFLVSALALYVSVIPFAAWLAASTLLLVLRYELARRSMRSIDGNALAQSERTFRLLADVIRLVIGAGIWVAVGATNDGTAYAITALICCYAVGTVVDLAHDDRPTRLAIPLIMIASPISFWMLHGGAGFAIAVALAGLAAAMIGSANALRHSVKDAVSIRVEKDKLVSEFEIERQVALDAVETADKANRSKSLFLASASHDLRQPLYAASLLRDTLALHDLPDAAAALVVQQGLALRTLTTLFDNLLDLSRLESGAVEPNVADFTLSELLRDIQIEFAPQCAVKGIEFEVETPDVRVHTDPQLLARMVRNLVSNAVRYTQSGSVRISVQRYEDDVAISVADTGIGIAPKDQQVIFGEFVQLANPQRSRDQGVGLGLSIVKHISRLLDCHVSVDSALGRGTRMTLRVARSTGSGHHVERASAPTSSNEPAACRVWLVEDDPIVREAQRAYLQAAGCAVDSAECREDLADLGKVRGWPDFVILDDMLSESETGLDVARWLSNHVRSDHILIVTGNVDRERWQVLNTSGIDAMRKPVPGPALLAWLRARSTTFERPS